VAYRGQPLKIVTSFGIATPQDTANSVEDLIKLALQRLQTAGASKDERIVGSDDISLFRSATLPSDIDRAVQVLEQASAESLGDASDEILRRLLPFLQAAFKRVKIELPIDKIGAILNKPK
jgi:hypothetical protein